VREQNNHGFRGERGISVWNIGGVRGVMMTDNPTIFRETHQTGSGLFLLRQSRRSWFRHSLPTGFLRLFRRGVADPTIYDYRGGDEKTVDSWQDAVENGELDDEPVIGFGSRVLKVLGIEHRESPLIRLLGRV
jgi:hypothetical protein